MGSIAAQVPEEVELRRLGWGYQVARLLLLVVGCISTPNLGGSNGPPITDRRPPPHGATESECNQMGREWLPTAAGGRCLPTGDGWRGSQVGGAAPTDAGAGDAGVDAGASDAGRGGGS